MPKGILTPLPDPTNDFTPPPVRQDEFITCSGRSFSTLAVYQMNQAEIADLLVGLLKQISDLERRVARLEAPHI